MPHERMTVLGFGDVSGDFPAVGEVEYADRAIISGREKLEREGRQGFKSWAGLR